MENVQKANSDEEEDFESADEGESHAKGQSNLSETHDVKNIKKNCKDPTPGQLEVEKPNVDQQILDEKTGSDEKIVKSEGNQSELSSSEPSPPPADLSANQPTINSVEKKEKLSSNNAANSEFIESEKEQPRTDTCDPTKVSTVTSGWGWGSWGAVLNQATNTMTSGLSQVIEKVESTLGIPEPGELQDKAHSKESKEDVITAEPSQEVAVEEVDSNSADTDSFFSSWGLTSLSNAFTSKGIELVNEGIGALETIGKKTMDVISEGDPGFRAKRDVFRKPSLSQVLREAKEEDAKQAAEKRTKDILKKVNFSDEFDRFQGLAHLEALEILSRECEAKVESALMDVFEDELGIAKGKLRAIEEVFHKACNAHDQDNQDNDDSVKDDFAVQIGKCSMCLKLSYVPNKLNKTEESVTKWIEECAKDQKESEASRTSNEIFSHFVRSFADVTAKSIEMYRKIAEMILMADEKREEEVVSAEERAKTLHRITEVVIDRMSSLSSSYAQTLNSAADVTMEEGDNITPLITEVYLECSNSSSLVQDAFKLLLPILEVSALNHMSASSGK